MDNSTFAVFDVLILGLGFYFFYAWYLVKFKGEVKEKLLLSRDYPFKKCKDKKGYLTYIAPRLLIFAIASVLAGALSLLNDYLNFLGGFYLAFALVFLVVVVWFAMVVKKGYKLFW